jgi:hypothetical protein
MKIHEKLKYIQDNHFSEWLKTRRGVENELSEKQSAFCICGRLATGLHESHCRKFQNAITRETLARLKHLIITKK